MKGLFSSAPDMHNGRSPLAVKSGTAPAGKTGQGWIMQHIDALCRALAETAA